MRVSDIPLAQIDPDPDQPRKEFRADALRELAASIRQVGIIEPCIVRPAGGRFVLVAGERRWRAAALAGLTVAPCVVTSLSTADALPVALIENLLRRDLTPLEEARAYATLVDDGWAPARIAETVAGGNLARVIYKLELLRLDGMLQDALAKNVLTESQAHTLSRLSPEGQHSAFAVIRRSGIANLQRVVAAIQEREQQAHLFQITDERRERDERRARRLFEQLAIAERAVGRCFERGESRAMGWVLAADMSRALPRLNVLIATLTELRRQLLASDARQIAAGRPGGDPRHTEWAVRTRRPGARKAAEEDL